MDRAGGVMAFGRDGQRTWSINLPAEVVGIAPGRGSIGQLLDCATGRCTSAPAPTVLRSTSMTLGVLPSGGLLALGHQVLIAAARGTIRPVRPVPGDASKP